MNLIRAGIFLSAASLATGCVIGDSTDGDLVVFQVGTPQPVHLLPGIVEHEVCVATNVEDGYVRASDFVGIPDVEFIGPTEGAPVQLLPLDGLECPPASEGFLGWARIRWQTQTGRNLATFVHEAGPFSAPSDGGGGEFKRAGTMSSANATTGEVVLDGEAFPGYDVVDSFVDDSQSGVIGVSLDLVYRDVGTLVGEPAADVPFTISYAPVDMSFALFGSSSGIFELKADRDGHNTLLFNQTSFCGAAFDPSTGDPTNVSVFVTPFAGGTVLAGTLEYDSFCF